MPRQLPWVNKGGKSQVQAKRLVVKRVRNSTHDQVGNLKGTTPGASRTTTMAVEESDDDLPELPAEPSTPSTKRSRKDMTYVNWGESSSPPSIEDLERPDVELMHKGVSIFDLRDDEWMMVEDELLETAKLFTRHLHIAEYEKLKEQIEAKRSAAEASRPVIAGAKMSHDRIMSIKAKHQEELQKRVIRDVLADKDDEDDSYAISQRKSAHTNSTAGIDNGFILKSNTRSLTLNDADDDGLDILRSACAGSETVSSATKEASALNCTPRDLAGRGKACLDPLDLNRSLSRTRPRPPKINRSTPFDMLDNYPRDQTCAVTPEAATHCSPAITSSNFQTSPLLRFQNPQDLLVTYEEDKSRVPTDSLNESGNSRESKGAADRLAKRRADREEEKQNKGTDRTVVKLDEIPTFLF